MQTDIHFQTHHLAQVYDAIAHKFSQTRSKYQHTAELKEICQTLNSFSFESKKNIRILELGCWDGRLYSYLKIHCRHSLDYTGVDISHSMIQLADQSHPDVSRVVDEMNHYLSTIDPMSYDVIVSIATYQHLATDVHRSIHMHLCYQVLTYDGICVMTNRSWSKRMLKKYIRIYVISILKRIISWGYRSDRNDMEIPFIINHQSLSRYYHILTLCELKSFFVQAWFVISKKWYLDTQGILTSYRWNAKNTFIVAHKKIHDTCKSEL